MIKTTDSFIPMLQDDLRGRNMQYLEAIKATDTSKLYKIVVAISPTDFIVYTFEKQNGESTYEFCTAAKYTTYDFLTFVYDNYILLADKYEFVSMKGAQNIDWFNERADPTITEDIIEQVNINYKYKTVDNGAVESDNN